MNKVKNSQSGFSLVELMIVVAIIGILSSIAVPQFQKFIFKARQTEAKTGLSALYTAEKAFYGEWSEYDERFGLIGFIPEGKYFYNIGFLVGSGVGISQSANYANTNATAYSGLTAVDTKTVCADTLGATTNPSGCKNMTNATDADALTGTVTNTAPGKFNAQARSNNLNPDTTGGVDLWSIDQAKNLLNEEGTL